MTASTVIWVNLPGPLWLWYGALLVWAVVSVAGTTTEMILRWKLWRARRRATRGR